MNSFPCQVIIDELETENIIFYLYNTQYSNFYTIRCELKDWNFRISTIKEFNCSSLLTAIHIFKDEYEFQIS